jgi:hypothetical protein
MIILWSAIASLSLAWFAGDALLGLLVAPQLFHHAEVQGVGKAFAGLVFGELLGRWEMIAGLSCVIPMVCMLAAVAGRRLKQRGWRTAVIPLAAALLVLGMHATAATVVKQGLATAAELREKPDPERAEAFRTSYHTRSRIVFSTEMLLALAVSIGSILAAARTARRGQA